MTSDSFEAMGPPFGSAGDREERFERLLARYSTLLHSLIVRHCPRDLGLQVADIEQEARLRLWKALEREKEWVDPASYIYRTAVNTTIDAVRRVLARREDQLQPEAGGGDPDESIFKADPAQSPEAVAQRRELMSKLALALEELPENRRTTVALHLQGLTLEEIGELLGYSEAKVRNLVYRGLADLREILRREGIELP